MFLLGPKTWCSYFAATNSGKENNNGACVQFHKVYAKEKDFSSLTCCYHHINKSAEDLREGFFQSNTLSLPLMSLFTESSTIYAYCHAIYLSYTSTHK